MDGARLKRARRRLFTYFIGSGVIMAFVFLMLASALILFAGVDRTSYLATLFIAAGVMAGGAYAIVLFGGAIVHVLKRILNRQPIMEIED